jgi:hypothetical protein
MADADFLADSNSALVVETATELIGNRDDPLAKLEALFLFVRDQILFGFPSKWKEWDKVTASHVIEAGYGYCNTKATLLIALCRASGISARVHCGLIDANLMRGVFPAIAFPFLPKAGSHSWTEVLIDGTWQPVDSYINDAQLFRAARKRLEESGNTLGFSLSCDAGKCSCEFNFGEKGFVHMGAVVEDHGVWEDPSQYFASDKYLEFNAFERRCYPVIAVLSNRNIRRLRRSG